MKHLHFTLWHLADTHIRCDLHLAKFFYTTEQLT